MKERYEDDIHNATAERLEEILEEIADGAMQVAKDDQIGGDLLSTIEFEYEVLHEAARRLRNISSTYIQFNHEQFE